MNVLLMHPDRDFDLRQELPRHASTLVQDLAMDPLLHAMAGNDEFVFQVVRVALLTGLHTDVDTIRYRQAIMKDGLKNPTVVEELYQVGVDALEEGRRHWWGISSDYPGSMLYDAVEVLEGLLGLLRKLRNIADKQADRFDSEGFRRFFAMLRKELTDTYLAQVQHHLTELRFRRGVLLSAELGEGNEGSNYVLRRSPENGRSWLDWILGRGSSGYTFYLNSRDETGARIVSDIRQQGISRVALALSQSAEHVRSFFDMLRTELAFYVGGLNLYRRLDALGEPICFPDPIPPGQYRHRFRGLYDASLSLVMGHRVKGNTADAEGKGLVIITGPNQGGKSVFLRSIGLAQVMMQCGLFVAAESFEANVCTGLFTHYKREEDATMKDGKLDEELARMSDIAEHIAPCSLVLCNESFAATNEREGSEIARQIVEALLDRQIKIFFVTHLYEFARCMFDRKGKDTFFLRAERRPDGTRTYRLLEGEPLETSYGEDLYREIFAVEAET